MRVETRATPPLFLGGPAVVSQWYAVGRQAVVSPAMGTSISLRRRLDWADTDAAGFWHHSTFWKFAEAGEAELARALGLSELMFGATPRRTVSAEFHRPLYFDDEVTITFTVEAVGRTSATYVTQLEVDGALAAEGRMVAVLIGDDGRPRAWPDDVAALLRGD